MARLLAGLVALYIGLGPPSVGPAAALNPNLQITQLGHANWRPSDGVLNSVVSAIAQTTDGYQWIGTTSGLLRFDGVRFVPWTDPGGRSLPSQTVIALLADRDGSLWIGTTGGLAHWTGSTLVTFKNLSRINAIAQDGKGQVWVARSRIADRSGKPLCRVDGDALDCFGASEGIRSDFANEVVVDRDDGVWIGSATHIARWKDGRAEDIAIASLAGAEELAGVTALFADHDGSLFVGMSRPGSGLGLQRRADGKLAPLIVDGVDSSSLGVSCLMRDPDGVLWIGTVGAGLYRIRGDRVDHFTSADGLSGDAVDQIRVDHERNVWVVTHKGLDVFREIPVVTFAKAQGLTAERVEYVHADGDDVWVGNRGAVDRIHSDGAAQVVESIRLPGFFSLSMTRTAQGRLWMAVDRSLVRFDQGRMTVVAKADAAAGGVVMSLATSPDGSVWGTRTRPGASFVVRPGSTVLEDLPAAADAATVFSDPDGGTWFSFRDGTVGTWKDERITKQGKVEGIPAALRAMSFDRDHGLLGSTGRGVIGFRKGRQIVLGMANGLPCESVRAIVQDRAGSLWLMLSCGIVSIGREDMARWWADPSVKVAARLFDAQDGAVSGIPDGVPRAARTRDGRLWFATGSVVNMVDPQSLPFNHLPPPVKVEALLVDRVIQPLVDDAELPVGVHSLQIDYTALSFVKPQQIRFKYQLEGHDPGWQEAGPRRQAFYNDLAPGAYRFRVIASNASGVWNETGDSLAFRIPPAWFQTWLFRLSCLCAVAAILWWLVRLRLRQFAAVLDARFEERLLERTRIARDLHDTVLQTVQASKLAAEDALADPRDEQLRPAIERLVRWLGTATEEARTAVHALRGAAPNDALVAAFRQAIDRLPEASRAAVSLVVDGTARTLSQEVRDEVFRIGWEAVMNAIAHAEAGTIAIGLGWSASLVMTIDDDGKGMSPRVLASGREGHFGLQGMRERATRIDAAIDIRSDVGAGTQVRVVVPLR